MLEGPVVIRKSLTQSENPDDENKNLIKEM